MISNVLGELYNLCNRSENVLNILTLGSVLASLILVIFTWRTVQKMHQSTQAQIIMSLLDDYASIEMRDAINELRRRKTQYANDYMAAFNSRRGEEPDWDRARRCVAHYYQKVAAMFDMGLLDKKFARVVATKEQVEFYREMIEPLEAVINPNYGPSSFNVLESLYGL